MKLCDDFAPNFGDKRLAVAAQQRSASHFLSPGIFFLYQKQHDCRPSPIVLA
jgi:hypothetical protein